MAVVGRNYMDMDGYTTPKKKAEGPIRQHSVDTSKRLTTTAAGSSGKSSSSSSAPKTPSKASGSSYGSKGSSSTVLNNNAGKSNYTPPADTGGYTETVNVPSAEDSYAKALEKFYDKQAEALREQQRAAERAMQAKINQGVNTLEGQKPALGQQFQDSAQQAYIQYMQSQKALPQAMAAQGLNGGASESSLASLESNYGNNVNALQDSYNRYLNDIDTDIANLKASGDISLAENAGNYAQQLGNLYAQQSADQLALLKQSLAAGSGGGPSGYSAKPSTTLNQTISLLEKGFKTPELLNAFKYYTGADWETDETSNQNTNLVQTNNRVYSAPTQLSNSALAYMRNRGLMLGSEEETNAADLLNQVAQGRLTPQDAQAIARYYGFSLNF